jgi:hypothetical protein
VKEGGDIVETDVKVDTEDVTVEFDVDTYCLNEGIFSVME